MICEDYPMRPLPFSLTGLVAVTCLFAANLRADVTPAALFCDHAVLQQGMPLPIWGTATDGETVTVTLAGQTASTIAKDGRWLVRLAPVTAGGPYQLVIAGRNRVECNDVLVGEVWLCSGQSNMEMKLGPVDGMQPVINWQEAVATSDQPEVRFFTVPRVHSLTPQSQVSADWKLSSPATSPSFSAVAFFFGRAIHQARHVPVGLIHSSWGGSFAEAWMSGDALRQQPDFTGDLAAQSLYLKDPVTADAIIARDLEAWYAKYDRGSVPPAPWSSLTATPPDWMTMSLPGYYEKAGLPDFDGVVWFRREFDLPDTWTEQSAELHLGNVDDDDTTWVNGVRVGATRGYNIPRIYNVPASALHAGKNSIAVRVLDTGGYGGFWGDGERMRLVRLGGPATDAVDLTGDWRFQAGVPLAGLPHPPQLMTKSVATPGALYNGMISPLLPYAMRGVIWYQGESNASQSKQYRQLFPALIADWRKLWGQGDFPFLFVQIAPWTGMSPEIREAQLLTTRTVRNTAMAVTLDVGDAKDIHPPHKQPVGERLALAARALAYGEQIEYSGPVYEKAQFANDHVVLLFSHYAGGLVAPGGELVGFTIAGADKKFITARAVIDGNTVKVSAPGLTHPTAVRYAWNQAPVGNLYNRVGLPASPFRTDVE